MIDSNIPCDSKTRGMPRISIDPGRHPVFTIVFTNLNGSDISVRDELSTLLPPSLNLFPSVSIPLSDRSDSNRLIRPIVPTTELRSFDTGQTRIIYPIEIFKTQIILPQLCLDASTNRGFSTWMIWRGREGDSIGF